ncbi:MAG TPA: succinyldiaminopimelate transaminase [Steroidobacteraceae bacterium]
MNPRLSLLHPYPFERLRSLLAGIRPPALKPIALSIGEPKHVPPAFIGEALCASLDTLGTYPLALGLASLRTVIARWLESRFELPGGAVRAEDMVLPVNGTREALFAFVQAAVDVERAAGDRPLVLMPNPFYQIYEGASLLAGAEPWYMNCTAATDYLPDLDAVPDAIWRRCQVLFLCSPGNPTGAVLSRAHLQRALELSQRYGFLIASDECYSELYYDESAPPPGLLQVAHAMGNASFERCVVFHSLSKRSSVPGLRSGFVAGDPHVLGAFRLYRTYHGCAVSELVQKASIPAWSDEAHVIENRRLYREKFARVVPLLSDALDVQIPAGSFYLWPQVGDDESFARGLFEQQHVTVVPGSYLARDTTDGNPGRGRVRISLVASVDDCVEAAQRIVAYVASKRR